MGGHKHENAMHKLVISGGVAFAFEMCGGHAVEFAKIVKQTSDLSYWQITKQMTNNFSRPHGILDGYFPWGAIQAIFKGAVFGWAHALIRNSLHKVEALPSAAVEIASGGLAGGVQGLVLSPMLLLKTRVMTDPSFRNAGNFVQATKASTGVLVNVLQKEGIAGVMKGSMWFSGKRVADWTTRFMFVELVERAWKSHKASRGDANPNKLSLGEASAASLLGGALSAIATIPIDIIVANIQQAAKAGQKVNIGEIFREQARKHSGWQGMMKATTRGLVARVVHVAITTSLMKTVCSALVKQYEQFQKKH
eukprot:TRINITY_DN3285_c0_g1_i1.p1 TRINITY_DN3285_c0_g1~~TRINITY_DN3285_c0_g1_i1.p1  ORF type:complete len:308 (-),score=115.95 TRINITY_DN3285_c0_g1_i1:173-1096(-)